MKLPLLLAALLWLGCLLPGRAQQLPVPALGARPALTHADSVAALHKVFLRNRWSGRYVGLLEGALLSLVIEGAANPSPSANKAAAGAQILSAAMVAGYCVGGIVRWARFSQRREREAVERFERRQAQPRYVQRSFDRVLVLAARPPRRGLFGKPERP